MVWRHVAKVGRAQMTRRRPSQLGDTALWEAWTTEIDDSLPPLGAGTSPTAQYFGQASQNHGWTWTVLFLKLGL